MVDLLRRLTDAPCALIGRPYPAEHVLHEAAPTYWRDLAGIGALLPELFSATVAVEAAQRGVAFIPQPQETIFQDHFTRARFKDGAMRMNMASAAPGSDFLHMNGDFGTLLIRDMLPLFK